MSSGRAAAFTRLDPDGRRRQILGAARQVFSEKPYSSVSMGDIAREAGVTRGLLHHYFGSKPHLYRALLVSLAEIALPAGPSEPGLSLESLIASQVDAWLDFIAEHRELALTIGAGMHPEDPELQEIAQAAREAIVDWIVRMISVDAEPPSQLRFLIRSYLGLTGAAAREWLYHERATRQDVHAMFTQALIALIRHALPALGDASG
jgi:AcrR family transcriptional regulator